MLPNVFVRTVTAIVLNPRNHRQFFVGKSRKHPRFVLPGGKVEKGETNETAVTREVFEETGRQVKNLRHLGFRLDPTGDTRNTTLRALESAEYTIAKNGGAKIQPDDPVLALYGVPDALYICTASEEVWNPTDEFAESRWMDVEEVCSDCLSAGHDVYALWYVWMLEHPNERLPQWALSNLQFSKQWLLDVLGIAI